MAPPAIGMAVTAVPCLPHRAEQGTPPAAYGRDGPTRLLRGKLRTRCLPLARGWAPPRTRQGPTGPSPSCPGRLIPAREGTPPSRCEGGRRCGEAVAKSPKAAASVAAARPDRDVWWKTFLPGKSALRHEECAASSLLVWAGPEQRCPTVPDMSIAGPTWSESCPGRWRALLRPRPSRKSESGSGAGPSGPVRSDHLVRELWLFLVSGAVLVALPGSVHRASALAGQGL